jgi:hypothetical protein
MSEMMIKSDRKSVWVKSRRKKEKDRKATDPATKRMNTKNAVDECK